MKKFALAFLIAGISIASAKSYSVLLTEPCVIGGKELKAGDYKMDVKDSKVVVSKGKESIESDVKVENSGSKYGATVVRYSTADGKYRVQEIRLGGTNMKLVFNN
jgi:hypothetical protein